MSDRPDKRRTGCAALAMLALACAGPRPAAHPVGARPAETRGDDARLHQRLEELRRGSAGVELAGIAMAYVAPDGTLRSDAAGCAHFDDDGRGCERDLTPDTVLRVASISKLITAMTALKLADEGKLDLERDVAGLLASTQGFALRNPAFADAPITLRQLLAHTSSLRDGAVYSLPPPATFAQLLAQPDRLDREHAPGSYFHYANINYGVVGAALETIAGMRFDALLQREVLSPAGVVAGYGWASVGPLATMRWGTLYRRRSVDDEVWDSTGPWIAQVDALPLPAETGQAYQPGARPQLFSAHGGLRISAADLARLVRALIAGWPSRAALLSPTALRELTSAPATVATAGDFEDGFYRGYALGNHAVTVAGRPLRGHFGDAYGLKGGVIFDPASGEVWVYLITGYGAPAAAGPASLPGLDAAEAAAVQLLWTMGKAVPG